MSGRSGRSILDGCSRQTTKPYLGWRSQENVGSDSRCSGRNTPNERLANSLRRSQQSNLDRFGQSSYGGGGSGGYSAAGHRHSRGATPGPAEWFVHDSIRSVSSAIAEFCKADDVPAAPLSAEEKLRRRRGRTQVRVEPSYGPKSRLVWLESSFVSSTTNVNKEGNSTQL